MIAWVIRLVMVNVGEKVIVWSPAEGWRTFCNAILAGYPLQPTIFLDKILTAPDAGLLGL